MCAARLELVRWRTFIVVRSALANAADDIVAVAGSLNYWCDHLQLPDPGVQAQSLARAGAGPGADPASAI